VKKLFKVLHLHCYRIRFIDNETNPMANAVLQIKIDKATKADVDSFSNLTLDAIEDAKKLANNPKAKRYSSAKELLEDCL